MRERHFHRAAVCSLVLALASGCTTMHTPRGGHFVAHGFYQADERYRVRAIDEGARTTLVPEPWELVGFALGESGVPGREVAANDRIPLYDFRYGHRRIGKIWARTANRPWGTLKSLADTLYVEIRYLGSPIPSITGVPIDHGRIATRFVSYGPASIDGADAFVVTFDLWTLHTDGRTDEMRITLALARPAAVDDADRSDTLVVFGFASPIERHEEGIADFESLLARVDFRPKDP